MEKSSLNIKFLRNLLPRRQGRSYKIPRENDNVKFHGGIINSTTTNCNVDETYTMRRGEQNRKPKANNDQKQIRGLICGNFTNIFNHYNSSFFLPILTPVSCRYENMFFNQKKIRMRTVMAFWRGDAGKIAEWAFNGVTQLSENCCRDIF